MNKLPREIQKGELSDSSKEKIISVKNVQVEDFDKNLNGKDRSTDTVSKQKLSKNRKRMQSKK